MPTRSSSDPAFSLASSRETRRWAWMTSRIWSRTLSTGFSAFIALWNTMAISRQRIRRSSAVPSRMMSIGPAARRPR